MDRDGLACSGSRVVAERHSLSPRRYDPYFYFTVWGFGGKNSIITTNLPEDDVVTKSSVKKYLAYFNRIIFVDRLRHGLFIKGIFLLSNRGGMWHG
jgi:hypothetical protein